MSKSGKTTEKNSDIARNIWLAGLGAYGRAFDGALNRYEQASKDTPKLFMDLVKRGEELEKNTREKVKPSELVRSNNIEDRIRKMRDNLSFGAFINRSDIERLEKKIDALGSKIDHLTIQQSKSANSRVPD